MDHGSGAGCQKPWLGTWLPLGQKALLTASGRNPRQLHIAGQLPRRPVHDKGEGAGAIICSQEERAERDEYEREWHENKRDANKKVRSLRHAQRRALSQARSRVSARERGSVSC